jgi:exopolysaccharide biosynthesis protein
MPQTESVKKAYQPDIWNQGTEYIRIVKEREKSFREKLDDEFAEGRAVQITEPQYVTIKHTLKKAKRLQLWRADKREAIKSGVSIYIMNDFPF